MLPSTIPQDFSTNDDFRQTVTEKDEFECLIFSSSVCFKKIFASSDSLKRFFPLPLQVIAWVVLLMAVYNALLVFLSNFSWLSCGVSRLEILPEILDCPCDAYTKLKCLDTSQEGETDSETLLPRRLSTPLQMC